MPVESAADRAAFLNPDEFGERILYRGLGGEVVPTVALWLRPGDRSNFGGETQIDVHRFMIERGAVGAVTAGAVVTVIATGEEFDVIRPDEVSADGAMQTIVAVMA
ncbi:MAG: hypothetical protein FJ335_07515 [Sphingomonadales bacterium]|nr:hypothetical protein [Sphingomonadales bacterium]